MSFILDALKKAESENQRQGAPTLVSARIAPARRRVPAWALGLGVVLLVNLALLAWLLTRAPARGVAAPGAAPPAQPQAFVGAAGAAVMPAAPAAAAVQSAAATTPAAAVVAEPRSAAGVATDAVNPADLEPAVAPAAGAAGEHAAPALRHYDEIASTMPPLRLDMHVYSGNAAERYAFINMQRVREGDSTTDGALVRAITREGVVLEYHGTEFLLGRQ
jgi:general secretion pathway protein B